MQLLKPHWIAKDGHPIFSIDIHPDGTRFATGGQGVDSAGRIAIWNMRPILDEKDEKDEKKVPRLLTQMDHHLGCVNCVRWSNSGTMLASGGDDKLVMIWKKSNYGAGNAIFGGEGKINVESWRCTNTLRSHNGDVLDLAWSPGDKLLATASVDNTVIIWNAENLPDIVKTLRTHSGLVKGVSFDPIGKFLATQSDDKTLRIWRIHDWKEDAVIKDPFAECGATTVVLRPGWAPDGSFLVSAHAMNEGGPTAQIVDRDTWKTPRDFVGHKKAISCVRFNPNLMLKTGTQDYSNYFQLVAIGSRDRSFSIWSTKLQRPFLVVTDVFDQSVLDISWSRDGKVVMACSMDGSVAAVVMSDVELGKAISEEKTHNILTGSYGKNFKVPVVKSSQNSQKSSNGTVVVENPILLKRKPHEETNGIKNPNKEVMKKPKGPTDKQIEALRADGKRRITPIFIPLDDVGSNTGPSGSGFGSGEFGSSSTQEKSRIEVEKRDEILKSPSKEKSSEEVEKKAKEIVAKKDKTVSISKVGEAKEKEIVAKETRTEKMEVDNDDDEIPVNTIAVRRKPRVLVSSDDEPEDKIKKTEVSKGKEAPKLNLVGSKRKPVDDNEESPRPKKRGRPPMSKSKDSDEDYYSPSKYERSQSYEQPKILYRPIISEMESQAVLPTLVMEKSSVFHHQIGDKKVTVQITNDFTVLDEDMGSVHVIKFDYENELKISGVTKVLLSTRISSLDLCLEYFIVTCFDSSLHMFSFKGERLLPPLMMPSAVSKVAVQSDIFAAVTTNGKFFQWRVLPGGKLKCIQKDQCILSLLQSGHNQVQVTIDKLILNTEGKPTIITSVGKSYSYCPDFGTWVKLIDQNDTIYSISSYCGMKQPKELQGGHLPLSTLEKVSASTRSLQSVPSRLRILADLSYSELQMVSSKHLESVEEEKFWLLQFVKHACNAKNESKLRELLDHIISDNNEKNIQDNELLKYVMEIISSQFQLQRLFMEYQERIQSKSEFLEINQLLTDKT